jgi:tol-pal system protein YbgF
MKKCLILALLMLAWTLPASAQRASLADRVAALEAQAATEAQGASQSNIELLNRTTQMQDEIRALRATIEQLQNELEQNRQRNREQYIDMDSRVSALEHSGSTGKSGATAAGKPAAAGKPDVSSKPPATAAAPAAGESADYQAAYNSLIKQGDAMTSAKQFQAFLQTYPNSRLAPNAWYWLGESYYALGSYDLALKSFGILLEQYGDSGKAPDALLKSGYCQVELKNTTAGKQTLEQVIAKYPTSPVAEMARSRLRGLSLDR